MAKDKSKGKKEAEEAEAPDADKVEGEEGAEGEEGGKKKLPLKMLIIAGAAAFVVLGGGGGAAFFFLAPKSPPAKEGHKLPPKAKGDKKDGKTDPNAPQVQDGPDVILSGSFTLTSTLLEHGLADEVLVVVFPVLLGTAKRIFADGTPPRSFELVSTKALASGVILSPHKPNEPLRTGTMGT